MDVSPGAQIIIGLVLAVICFIVVTRSIKKKFDETSTD